MHSGRHAAVTVMLLVFSMTAAGTIALASPVTRTSGASTVPGQSARLQAVSNHLRTLLDRVQPAVKTGPTRLLEPSWVTRFYAGRDYRPAWLTASGRPSPEAERLLTLLQSASAEGLESASLHRREVVFALRGLQIAYATTPQQLADFDILLSDSFLAYARRRLDGQVVPQRTEPDWAVPSRSQDLAEVLQHALQQHDLAAALRRLDPPYPGYQRLRRALQNYRRIAASGGWQTLAGGPKLERGMSEPRVGQLRARLQVTGDLADATEQRPAPGDPAGTPATGDDDRFGPVIEAAVQRFQARHGLTADGMVGRKTLAALNEPVAVRIRQIELNMERWRWLPANLGQRYIWVNVPGFELKVSDHGRTVLHSRVIVGRPQRPTPLFSARLRYIVFSPYWHVPYTIAVKDKLPELRKNPYALRKLGIRIFMKGREIDPGSVAWKAVSSRDFDYTLRQDPGPENALGGIKFMFPNRHSVYIHDTPNRYLFQRVRRTFSSGCIRTDSAVQLASYLLQGTPHWDRARIIAASRNGDARRVDLPEPVPVYLLYFTAWVEPNGTVQFRNDIYNHDVRLERLLFAH